MVAHIVEMIISICLHQNVVAAIAQSWRITYQRFQHNGMQIVLCVGIAVNHSKEDHSLIMKAYPIVKHIIISREDHFVPVVISP
uniref:Putative secreted protein n=1 Tax=Panstrongylus lignarius TaxID=156445 RepID=A0A224Y2X5_9HEMI